MNYEVLVGDCRETLKTLPDESVHCVVTSPPYFGLRDYGEDEQIGLEAAPDDFVQALVKVFREVRRVLRDDGTVWLNLGDSYAGSGKGRNGDGTSAASPTSKQATSRGTTEGVLTKTVSHGLKQKDLIGIPWRVAFALQADGWYLRQDIIWSKPNPMPESVKDRCTKSHEYVFLLTKSPKYFYDHEAVKEPATMKPQRRLVETHFGAKSVAGRTDNGGTLRTMSEAGRQYTTRNRRSVWTVTTKPFKGAHFATYPPDLIDPCILAGTSNGGCCSECGAPYARKSGRPCPQCDALIPTQANECKACGFRNTGWLDEREDNAQTRAGEDNTVGPTVARKRMMTAQTVVSEEYLPTCDCDAENTPCTVLDPFGGSGTTAGVALKHGRKAILCELNPEYAALVPRRIEHILGYNPEEHEKQRSLLDF